LVLPVQPVAVAVGRRAAGGAGDRPPVKAGSHDPAPARGAAGARAPRGPGRRPPPPPPERAGRGRAHDGGDQTVSTGPHHPPPRPPGRGRLGLSWSRPAGRVRRQDPARKEPGHHRKDTDMAVVRTHHYSVDPADLPELLARRAEVIAAVRAAHPGLSHTRLIRLGGGTFTHARRWGTAAQMQGALARLPISQGK